MNTVILMGRLTKAPEVRESQSGTKFGVYTLAVDRWFKREGEPDADFINCVVFGKGAEFAEKYLGKGQRVAIVGRIQTRSYTNKYGAKVYTTEVVVENQEFADSKRTAETPEDALPVNQWLDVPEGSDGEMLFK